MVTRTSLYCGNYSDIVTLTTTGCVPVLYTGYICTCNTRIHTHTHVPVLYTGYI